MEFIRAIIQIQQRPQTVKGADYINNDKNIKWWMGFDRLWDCNIFVPGVFIKEVVFQGMGKSWKGTAKMEWRERKDARKKGWRRIDVTAMGT